MSKKASGARNYNMLGDIKIKNKLGKTICVGRFKSVNTAIEYHALTKKSFVSCNFDDKYLHDIKFYKSRIIGCSFKLALIQKCDLSECFIHSCSFSETKIIETNMDMTEARKCNFDKASIVQCILSYSKIINCSFNCASLDSSTRLTNSKIYESSFADAILINVNFTGSRISDSNFNEAHLSGVCLDDCVIFNTSLHNARMKHASLMGANLDHSSMTFSCKIESIKASDRLVAQMIYHVTRLDFSGCSDTVRSELIEILNGPLGDMFLKYRTDLRSAEKTIQNHDLRMLLKHNKIENESDINERTVY